MLAIAAILVAGGATRAQAQATYTYNGSGNGQWTNASSWTPSRSSPQTTDVLVFDGNLTASPTVGNVPTQTIGRLRILNGANVLLEAGSNTRVITLTGTGTPALELGAGGTLRVGSTRTLEITLAGASTGALAGQVIFEDQGHRLTAASAGAITFASGASFTSLPGFRGNPFGNAGTAGIVVFAAGSSYLHNTGDGPFGLAAPASRAVFQDGSTYVVRNASGADVAGRALANLTVENNVTLNASSAASFGVQTLLVRTGCGFAYTGSGASSVQVRGDLTIAGTGTIALTAGTGGIQINGGVTQTIGPSAGTGSISFGGPATVATGTRLVLARALANASHATTMNGTLELEAAGAISGPVTYGPGAALVFDTGASPIAVAAASPFWPAASGPTHVTVLGAGGIAMGAGADRTVAGTVRAAGPIAGANRLTIGDTLRIEAVSPLGGSPTYLADAALRYGTGTHVVGPEWIMGFNRGLGVPEHVVVDAGAGGSVATPAQDRYVPGDVLIASGSLVLNSGGGNLLVRGDWTSQGTLVPNDRTVVFQGSADQTLSRAGGETFDVLHVEKPAGTLTLLSSLTTRLAFLDGVLVTGPHELVLKPGGSLTRISGWVDGTLRKPAAAALAFEVGATAYAPVSLALAGLGGTGTVAASTRTPDATDLASSALDPARTANRSWSLSASGVTFSSASATFTFVPGDLDAGADPLTFDVVRRDGGAWSEATTGARTATSTQATGLTALGEFAAGTFRPHTITASPGPGGSITPAGAVSVPHHGDQSFTIAADPHHHLLDVLVDGVSVGPIASHTFTDVVTDHTIAATFAVDRHTVAVAVAGNGAVTKTPNQPDYPWGSVVRLDATAAPNHHFVGWTGDTVTSANPLDLPVLGDRKVTATFAIDMHPLTTNIVGGGSVTRSPNQSSFAHGTVVQLNAYPAAGYAFAGWSGDATGTNNPVLVTMTEPRTVVATFTSASYPVAVTAIGPGTITRSPDLASYPYGSILQLTATPEPGASFVGWSGSVTGASNPITLTVDGAENVFATFSTGELDYVVSHVDAPWEPIAVATGATPVLVAAHDSTRSVPLAFDFPYFGTVYRGVNNHLAISANGYAYFARWPVTATSPTGASNQNLYSPAAPNATLAPWYDDLAVAPAGANPAGAVLAQTLGEPGDRRQIVQWTNVSSWFNDTGGQPRQISFQLQLHEATGAVEFHYGPVLGAAPSLFESASIGIEDSLGGNNHYRDGVTGSRLTSFGMLSTDRWPDRAIRFVSGVAAPLPGGVYDVGLAGDYRNLNDAFRDLNQRGVAGPVTLNLVGAVYDTTAAGGEHGFPLLLGPVSGASAANPIMVEGNGAALRHRGSSAGFCGNQASTNAISVVNEPVLGLVGADHVTVANLEITGGVEADRGVLLLNSSRSDGSQHAELRGVSVRLQRTNPNSIGVQQHALLVPTSLDGTNSHNRYVNLTIENAYSGIALTGNGSLFDVGCFVGGDAGGRTVVGGASAGDLGGGPTAVFGVRATNQSDLVIADTDVRSLAGTGAGNVDGIAVESQGVLTTGQGTLHVARNRVSGLTQSSFVGGRVVGLRLAVTANPTSVLRVYNNTVHGLSSASTSTASRRVLGILAQESTNGAGGVLEIDFNSVRLEPAGLFASNACFELGTTSGPVVRVRNNVFANLTAPQSGSARHYAWVSGGGSLGPAGSASDRNVLHVANGSNGFTGRVGGADRATLDQWRAATGGDANSRAEDPRFVAADDLHLSTTLATPAEGIASFFNGAITWAGTDVDGDARHATTPDAGADEGDFVPLDLHDVAAVGVDAPPPDSLLVAGMPFAVAASFLNKGILDQTGVPVRLQILGPMPATAVVYDEAAAIPSIVNGATIAVSFPAATVPGGGRYVVRARAELPTDQRRANDSTEVEVEVADRLAGDYLVGAGRPAPFTTLTDAVARLNYVGAVGPVRFLLEDASYGAAETFPIVIGRPPGVGAANPVTIQPAPGVTAVLSGTSASALVVLDGSDHVTIDGSNLPAGTTRNLMLQNLHAGGASAVVWARSTGADGATMNAVLNARVQGSGSTLVGVGFGGPAIALDSDGVGHAGNRIENVLVERAQVGIYVAGAPGTGRSPGTVVARNNLDALGANQLTRIGILARHQDGIEVSENRVAYVSGGASGAIGIALGLTTASATAFAGDEVVNAVVSRNRVDQIGAGAAGAAGIALARTSTGTSTVVNNMVSRVVSAPPASGITAGILAGGGATRILFNSVAMTGDRSGAAGPSYALALADSTSPTEVRNNVLVNTQTGGTRHAIGVAAGLSFAALASDANDFHAPGGPLAKVGGLAPDGAGALADLAAWRARTGRDAASISADPLFLAAANLHVTSALSPIANAGQPVAGVTVDYDGEAGGRATRPDLGADEFTTWSLGVTIAGQGGVVRAPDQPSYAPGSVVQLTATPATGWHFVGWSGDASGATNPLEVLLDGHRDVVATFAINTYALTVATTGNGAVTRAPDQPLYDHGTVVTLTATPAEGWHFTGWTGAVTGTTNPVGVTMDAAKSVTATFAINTYPLTVNVAGNGTVARAPDQPLYDHGTVVTLTATPAEGWHFVGWSGAATGATNPLAVTMNAAKTITATFAINTYTLDVTVNGSGAVVEDPDLPFHDHGTTVTLTAVPAVGHHFEEWSGDLAGSDNPATLTMTANRSVLAMFAINTYPLTVSTTGSGTVARAPNLTQYPHGSIVTLTATPAVGWHLARWSGDATGAQNPLQLTMDGPKTVTAEFEINTYALQLTTTGNGTVEVAPQMAAYPHGTTVTLTPVSGDGSHFLTWGGDTTTTAAPLTIVMTRARTISAQFVLNSYDLTVSTVGNGSVARQPNQPAYDHGTRVVLTANPATGHHFTGWSGDLSGAGNPDSVLMVDHRTVTASFAINTYPLAVSTVGSGAVTRVPDQPLYDHGTVVALQAHPAVGWHFVGWSGDTTSADTALALAMTSARTLTATFAIDTHPLNVTVVGQGTVARAPSQPVYDYGTVVALTATPAVGWHFVGWSGDAAGAANPVEVTMHGPRNVTATFEIDTHPVTVTVVGPGAVTRSPDQPLYDYGTTVTLTPQPAANHHFVAWSGDATGTASPLAVLVDAPKAITATFAIDTWPLAVTVDGSGTVARSPDQPEYDHGAVVTLTATPAVGWHFAGWTGDVTDTAAVTTVTMTAARAVTATFAIDTHPLEVAVDGPGAVLRDPDQPLYDYGTVVTLTAVPEPYHHLVSWSGDASGSANPVTVTMLGPRSVGASFAIDTHPLQVAAQGSGAIARSPDQPAYAHGTPVTLTATPEVGWHFVGWSGDTTATDPVLVLPMIAARSVTATFAIDTHPLATAVVGSGTVARSPDAAVYDYGTVVTLTAAPATGWHFTGWSGDASGATSPVTVTMTAARSVTATFAIDTYALAVATEGDGTVARSPDQPLYDYGTAVTLTATAAPGWHLDRWSGDASGAANPLVLDMDAPKSVTAHFVLDSHALSVTVVGAGTVTRAPDLGASYPHGTAVTLTAQTPVGWTFSGWSGDTTATDSVLALTMTRARDLTATFTIKRYALNVSSDANGTVHVEPGQALYDHGTTVVLTAIPAANYQLASWTGDAGGAQNPLAVVMDGDKSIGATFAVNTYPLDVSVTGTGAVALDPDQGVYSHGQVVTLTATAGPNWHFVGWSGGVTGSANPAQVTMDGPRTVTATFEIDSYPINVTVVGSGAVARNPALAAYPHGSSVQLTAQPAFGWVFKNWGGDLSGTQNPATLTMLASRNVTATFEVARYTVTVNKVGNGSVAKSPNQTSYVHGTTVTVSANPSGGYRFAGWSGDTTGTANPFTVTLHANKSYVASFVESQIPLVEVLDPNGGEAVEIGAVVPVLWTAEDNVGVTEVDVLLSRTSASGPWETLASNLANTGSWSWTVTGPTTSTAWIRVVARDAAGNSAADVSDAALAVINPTAAAGDGPAVAFALAAPTPNPARGPVRVRFAVPVESRIRLALTDVQGREVAVLAEGVRAPGWHEALWTGGARPGVYFVRFEGGGRRHVRRLVISR